MDKTELLKLCEEHSARHKELIAESINGVSFSGDIHMRHSVFIQIFEEYETVDFKCEGSDYTKELSAIHNGVRYFSIY